MFYLQNMWRSRALGPPAYGNAARDVVDCPNVEGLGSKNRKITPATISTTAICQVLGSRNGSLAKKIFETFLLLGNNLPGY